MANLCYTNVTIKGNLEELLPAMEEALFPEGISDEWIGNLLLKCGMTMQEISDSGMYTRGDIIYFEGDKEEILLEIESAWSPIMDPITMICNKYAPDAEIYYTAIEPGMGIYATNEPEKKGSYYCELHESVIELYDYYTKDELKEIMENDLKKQGGFSNLLKEFKDLHEDVNISEMQFIPLDKLGGKLWALKQSILVVA